MEEQVVIEEGVVVKSPRVFKAKKEKRRKSLFEASGSYEPLHFKVKDNQELVEEQRILEEENAVRELKLMEEQVVIEEGVVEEVVLEGPAGEVVIENVAMQLQEQNVSLMVADVDPNNPDTYTLALLSIDSSD